MAGSVAACFGQAYTPPPPALTTLPPCPVPKDAQEAKKIAKRRDCDPTNRPVPPPARAAAAPAASSAAQQFPFPGDEPAAQPAAQPATPAGAPTPAAKSFPYPGDAAATAPVPSAAKKFPYPGDSAAPAGAGQDGATTEDGAGRANPNVPHDPAAEKRAAGTPAGKAFPYPGASGSDAPATANPRSTGSAPAPDASSSSSSASAEENPATSSSSRTAFSDDDDDTQPKLADKGSEGKQNRKTVKPQTDNERVDEDLSVAKYYGQSGNPMGAYLRAKDAVKMEPDLAEARFVLGEAAKRLKKTDEAKAEFIEYLKLSPDGEHARAAEKALSELQ